MHHFVQMKTVFRCLFVCDAVEKEVLCNDEKYVALEINKLICFLLNPSILEIFAITFPLNYTTRVTCMSTTTEMYTVMMKIMPSLTLKTKFTQGNMKK